MIYDINHVTTYRYGTRVAFARCLFHLEPRATPAQRVLSSRLSIDPPPAEMTRRLDVFGNVECSTRFADPHAELVIRATARVEVLDVAPDTSNTLPWEVVAGQVKNWPELSGDSPVHFAFPSELVPRLPEIIAYAQESFLPQRPIVEACQDLMRRIHLDFIYDPEATTISTPLRQAFAQKAGVCQDFAHLMISGLRGLGLPGAYVSGYLRTRPPDGGVRLQGADATHAWVSVWCGAATGWINFDPTNNRLSGPDHVVLAFGRDYADVAPVKGVVLASAAHSLTVEVDVSPV